MFSNPYFDWSCLCSMPIFGFEATEFDGVLDQRPDHVEVPLIEWLLEVPERARTQRFHRILQVCRSP